MCVVETPPSLLIRRLPVTVAQAMTKALERFDADEGVRVMLMPARTTAAGLTLTRASRVILLEPAPDPAIPQQACNFLLHPPLPPSACPPIVSSSLRGSRPALPSQSNCGPPRIFSARVLRVFSPSPLPPFPAPFCVLFRDCSVCHNAFDTAGLWIHPIFLGFFWAGLQRVWCMRNRCACRLRIRPSADALVHPRRQWRGATGRGRRGRSWCTSSSSPEPSR